MENGAARSAAKDVVRTGGLENDYAPALELMRRPHAGLAAQLFEREPRNERWAHVVEGAIAPGVESDLKRIGGHFVVECRTLGCRVRADAPVSTADDLSMMVQLVPCATGTIDGETEREGRYFLDYYCFYDPQQGDPATFAAWYADIYQKMRANLARAAEGTPR